MGPNQELSGNVLGIRPTQAFRILTPNNPEPLETASKSTDSEYEAGNEGMTGNNVENHEC